MSLFGILSLTQTAMNAQSGALAVAGQNVTNASTPGYVKRRAELETIIGSMGSRFVGVSSARDRFAHERVTVETGRRGAASARSTALGQLQNLVAPTSGAIGDRLSAFFAATQNLVANPADTTARTEVLAKGRALASAVSDTAAGLLQQRSDLLGQAQGVASQVNESLTKIAELNQKIEIARGTGDDASDLRDERDRLVGQVADRVGAHAIEDDKGHFTLFGAGGTLVDGNTASSVGVDVDPNGDLKVTLQMQGGLAKDVTQAIQGGQLAGLRQARDVDVPKTQKELDQFAYDLSTAINTVHSAGYGLDAVTGRNFFAAPAQVAGAAYGMKLDPSVDGQPSHLAAAATANTLPGGNANALALAQLATKALGIGTDTPDQRVSAIVAGVGTAKAASDDELSLREATVSQAETMRDSAEGVNVDEDMVDLTRYQRAYEASIKVTQTADEMLQTLMGMKR